MFDMYVLELQFSYAINTVVPNIVRNIVDMCRMYNNSDLTTVCLLTLTAEFLGCDGTFLNFNCTV